ncbi:MAG: NAD(P)(+) transhydrogenase (Re/Si-specific) subunit beta [Daejeonella sp.]
MHLNILTICYLFGSITFITGLKMLSHPESARRGNLIAAIGMLVSILGTIFLYEDKGVKLGNYTWIFAALFIGTVLGTMTAKKVKMTAMPEMVSLFNGMGGACAALISIVEFNHLVDRMSMGQPADQATLLIIFAGLIIGTISFAGSMVAWGKLNGSIKDFSFKGQHIANLAIFAVIIILSAYLIIFSNRAASGFFYVVLVLSVMYGLFFVLPIGGADMPVVISLLNSFTGVAAALGGFLYNNPVMLTGGILVGSAGTILTILMCKAMNRPLSNVLIGSFGGASSSQGGNREQGSYKQINISDSAVVMSYAKKVIIVPGYGLAVAQAQHICHELEKLLSEKGVEVTYAIHPVAGRMPGHMNVLLAEAGVDYDRLLEMEQANEEFPAADVVLILGANDVVNPAAKTDPASPIYGMPVLDVGLSKLVIINKRSMNPGYAGIENELFFQPKSSMLFGDAKSVLQQLVAEIKTL